MLSDPENATNPVLLTLLAAWRRVQSIGEPPAECQKGRRLDRPLSPERMVPIMDLRKEGAKLLPGSAWHEGLAEAFWQEIGPRL